MNFVTGSIIVGLIGILTLAGFLSYTGYGIGTEKNDKYIREAVGDNRTVRGGGTSFGK